MPAQNGSQVNESTTAQEDGGQRALLRELKGAPLSVMLALEIHGAQGRSELMERTGWGRNAVSDALVLLEELRLVTRLHYRCWELRAEQDLVSTLESEITERPSNNPSGAESPADNLSAESPADNLSGSESPSGDLSAESPSGNLSASESSSGNLSRAESPSHNLSAPHDHDGVIDTKEPCNQNKHHPSKTTRTKLARALKALDPPFENARLWLQEASPRLVQGWLDYLQNLDRESRRRIRNEAAFLRWKVESEEQPPPAPKQRAPCKRCNKAIRDAEGRCLVCLGLVAV